MAPQVVAHEQPVQHEHADEQVKAPACVDPLPLQRCRPGGLRTQVRAWASAAVACRQHTHPSAGTTSLTARDAFELTIVTF